MIDELRLDATRRRLGWTAIADLSPVTLEAVVRTEDRGSTLKPFVHALALEAVPCSSRPAAPPSEVTWRLGAHRFAAGKTGRR